MSYFLLFSYCLLWIWDRVDLGLGGLVGVGGWGRIDWRRMDYSLRNLLMMVNMLLFNVTSNGHTSK